METVDNIPPDTAAVHGGNGGDGQPKSKARFLSLSDLDRGMSRLFVEHCEAVAAKINITRRWLGEQ